MYHQVGGVQQASRRPLNDVREPTGPSNWTFSPDHTHQGAAVYGWSLKLDARKWAITIFFMTGASGTGYIESCFKVLNPVDSIFWWWVLEQTELDPLTLVALETEQDRVKWTTWQ